MILYFSGTGNSAFAAKKIADVLGEECFDLFSKIRNNNYEEIYSDNPFVLVCPTYGWQIPHILESWLLKTPLKGSKKIYFIMTCGQDIGNSKKYVQKLCDIKQLTLMGCAQLVMPENYIAMFSCARRSRGSCHHQKIHADAFGDSRGYPYRVSPAGCARNTLRLFLQHYCQQSILCTFCP